MHSQPIQKSVLITGCSDGGLGAALAVAFHEAGLFVYATARDLSKMKELAARGIKILALDVLSDTSIANCISSIPSLDFLVNNAGAMVTMPVSDLSIPAAKELFDINVWAHIAMTQACLPLLLKSTKPIIVNQTSISSVASIPFQAAYSASKAAMAMFSSGMKLELGGFGITVIDLKTGIVRSNLIKNIKQPSLPEGSIYTPAKAVVEKSLQQDEFADAGMASDRWAKLVVQDVLKKHPPGLIWRGEQAMFARIGSVLPFGMLDGMVKKLTGMDVVELLVRK